MLSGVVTFIALAHSIPGVGAAIDAVLGAAALVGIGVSAQKTLALYQESKKTGKSFEDLLKEKADEFGEKLVKQIEKIKSLVDLEKGNTTLVLEARSVRLSTSDEFRDRVAAAQKWRNKIKVPETTAKQVDQKKSDAEPSIPRA